MATIATKEGQCMLDLCMQATGSIDAVVAIAQANGLSITDVLEVDQAIAINAAVVDARAVAYFNIAGNLPASDVDVEGVIGGIGYMQIGNDFKVN